MYIGSNMHELELQAVHTVTFMSRINKLKLQLN